MVQQNYTAVSMCCSSRKGKNELEGSSEAIGVSMATIGVVGKVTIEGLERGLLSSQPRTQNIEPLSLFLG